MGRELIPDYTFKITEIWKFGHPIERFSKFRKGVEEKLDGYFNSKNFTKLSSSNDVYAKNNKQAVVVELLDCTEVYKINFYIIGNKEFRKKILVNLGTIINK